MALTRTRCLRLLQSLEFDGLIAQDRTIKFFLFRSVVGSLGGSLLSFPFPALFHFKLVPNLSKRERILDCCLMVLGLAMTAVCTVTSVINLIEVM